MIAQNRYSEAARKIKADLTRSRRRDGMRLRRYGKVRELELYEADAYSRGNLMQGINLIWGFSY